jgi:HNH endonuclease
MIKIKLTPSEVTALKELAAAGPPGMKAGSIAGTLDSDGNRVIRINRRMYIAPRLAWLLVKGRWPKGPIQHRNCIKDDNRFANLRLVGHRR